VKCRRLNAGGGRHVKFRRSRRRGAVPWCFETGRQGAPQAPQVSGFAGREPGRYAPGMAGGVGSTELSPTRLKLKLPHYPTMPQCVPASDPFDCMSAISAPSSIITRSASGPGSASSRSLASLGPDTAERSCP